ncbi:hypothetical protein [Cupriavidus pauculus]|uniref:hypothetical protein n=1 Tax=Cupriavidus pauculus TaxID=82633 RepID=UPI001D0C6BBD|nr:hypothetical protein [Cupriavidus pauculus]
MPVDFARVPPRVRVPPPPRPAIILWAILLVIMIGAGAGLTFWQWPAGKPTNTLGFWCCAIVYPVFAWVLVLCFARGIAYARRVDAMAINHVSARIEQERHAQASEPLAVLGYAWCFSGDAQENTAEGIGNGRLKLDTRSSAAEPGTDVCARWLEVPGLSFSSGNVLLEHKRHQALCNWLVARMIDRLGGALAVLPNQTTLHVDVCNETLVDLHEVQSRLQALILEIAPTLKLELHAHGEHMPLFRTDAWHDRLKPREGRLLVALQLRNALSERLQDGVAEAGVALLLGRPHVDGCQPALRLHRPAKGKADGKSEPFDLAVRWGQATAAQIRTIWNHCLSEDLARPVKSASHFNQQAQWIDVGTTVGDCGGVGAWLATALALEHAALTGQPQLILSEQDGDLVALVCKSS